MAHNNSGQNIFYRRVSSAGQNLARQEIPDINFDKVFEEKMSAANAEKRPELQSMLNHIREGDHIYVYSLDRLARNLLDLEKLVQEITTKNVHISFYKEGLTFKDQKDTDPYSNLMLQMMAAFAEFERNLIKERQREGILKAKAEGKYNRKLTEEQRNEIREKYASKQYSYGTLSKEYDVTRSAIQKIVTGVR